MQVTHILPAGWVDTGEAGKIQPSAVVGMAHQVTMTPEEIESLRGPAGPQGLPGADGAPGQAGPQGLPGADGATGPAGPQGLSGADGAPGQAGPQGLPGADGATGPAGPQGLPGADGATGPAGPQGPAGAVGAPGPAGSQVLYGTLAPASVLGANGDWYLRTATGDFYQKAAGAWALRTNLKGPAGAQGPQGPAGADGAPGPAGPQGPAGAGFSLGSAGGYGVGTILATQTISGAVVRRAWEGGGEIICDGGSTTEESIRYLKWSGSSYVVAYRPAGEVWRVLSVGLVGTEQVVMLERVS